MTAGTLAPLLAVLADGATPAAMSIRPPIGSLPGLKVPKPARFVLPNGLTVIAVPRRAAPIVAVQVVVRSGSASDPADGAGLAAAVADMLDEGAGSRQALDIARDIEQLGADLSTSATRDGAQISLQVPAAGLSAALRILSDMLTAPRFDPADWARVKNDRVTALIQRRDQPDAVAALVGDRVVFGDEHPYGRPVAGYEQTVQAMTAADLRRHFDAVWRPNHATVVMSGDFDVKTLRPLLSAVFAKWKRAPVPPLAAGGSGPDKRPRLVIVDKPGAPQTVLLLIGPGVARWSPDRPALSMLSTILGGSFTSRLNFNLREQKGYTYGARSSFTFPRLPGAFTAGASVFTKVTDASVTEILAEFSGVRGAPVRPEELTKARAILLERVAEGLSTAVGTVGIYADVALYGLPLDEPARFAKALAKADVSDLQQLAQRSIDPSTISIIAVGDRRAIEPGLQALRLGVPEIRTVDGSVLGPTSGGVQ